MMTWLYNFLNVVINKTGCDYLFWILLFFPFIRSFYFLLFLMDLCCICMLFYWCRYLFLVSYKVWVHGGDIYFELLFPNFFLMINSSATTLLDPLIKFNVSDVSPLSLLPHKSGLVSSPRPSLPSLLLSMGLQQYLHLFIIQVFWNTLSNLLPFL